MMIFARVLKTLKLNNKFEEFYYDTLFNTL